VQQNAVARWTGIDAAPGALPAAGAQAELKLH
jgi:hypothetical protein